MHRSSAHGGAVRARRAAWGVAAGALLLAAASCAPAHELGAVRVRVDFAPDGDYRIEMVVDTAHLPPDLRPLPGDAASADARRRALRARLLEAAAVSFDGSRVPLEEQPIAEGGRPGPGTGDADAPTRLRLRLAGAVPRGARRFTWSLALPVGSTLLEIHEAGGPEPTWEWLDGAQTSTPFALHHAGPPQAPARVARQYLVLGYTHILPHGLDHILFVLGLFLLSLRWRTILQQVTAFTVAHSITLGLAMYGVVSLSPRLVEPLIALSIVAVAVENLFAREARPRRVAIVFGFGLLHGMGFAGVLRELGLPRADFATALVAFNVGVEAGQLSVIAAAFVAVGLWFGDRPWYRRRLSMPASLAISLVGLYWTAERVLG